MATIHVLDHQPGQAEYRVAVHWAVPAGNNSAGVAWKTALLNSGAAGTTVLKDGDGTGGTISAAEKAQVASCDVVESVETIRLDSVPLANVNAYLDAQAMAITARAQARLQDLLRFWGGTR